MIEVTRLDNSRIVVNAETIQSLQSVPDTVITFMNKASLMVKEPVEVISQKIEDYQRKVHDNLTIEAKLMEESPGTIN